MHLCSLSKSCLRFYHGKLFLLFIPSSKASSFLPLVTSMWQLIWHSHSRHSALSSGVECFPLSVHTQALIADFIVVHLKGCVTTALNGMSSVAADQGFLTILQQPPLLAFGLNVPTGFNYTEVHGYLFCLSKRLYVQFYVPISLPIKITFSRPSVPQAC